MSQITVLWSYERCIEMPSMCNRLHLTEYQLTRMKKENEQEFALNSASRKQQKIWFDRHSILKVFKAHDNNQIGIWFIVQSIQITDKKNGIFI